MSNLLISTLLAALSLEPTLGLHPLKHLIDYDKTICLEKLTQCTHEELWDNFLEGQNELLFKVEYPVLASADWWQKTQSILEIGSGNGAYLHHLFQHATEKYFLGIEIQSSFVEVAVKNYQNTHLQFKQGDIEFLDSSLENSADMILFRLTLQHVKNPLKALENAWEYLLPGGHMVIIESYDHARKTSHQINTINQASKLLRDYDQSSGNLNRTISIDILKQVENTDFPLSHLYEVIYSNLDQCGNSLHDTPYFLGEAERKKFFNHILLFLTICHRIYNLPLNLETAYDELQDYVADENAWTTIGTHFLILKKKETLISNSVN